MKPSDLDRLGDDGVVWLFEQTYRAKMMQPLGTFSEWLHGLERDRLRVAMVYDRAGKSRLRLVAKGDREPSSGGGAVGEAAKALPKPSREPGSARIRNSPPRGPAPPSANGRASGHPREEPI